MTAYRTERDRGQVWVNKPARGVESAIRACVEGCDARSARSIFRVIRFLRRAPNAILAATPANHHVEHRSWIARHAGFHNEREFALARAITTEHSRGVFLGALSDVVIIREFRHQATSISRSVKRKTTALL